MRHSPLACLAPSNVEYDFIGWDPLVGVPFSVSNPLVFHVLTQSPKGPEGEREALRLIEAGTAIAPPDMRPADARGLVFPRDEAAGDGRYVFLSPFNTFGAGSIGLNRHDFGRPAFAFDAIALSRASGFAFRLHDAEGLYAAVEPPEYLGDFDFDDEWETLSEDERSRRYEELRADLVREDLECVADALTIVDPQKALKALLLLAQLSVGLVTKSEARKIAQTIVPETDLDEDWCPLAAPVIRRSNIGDRWMELLTEPVEDVTRLWRQPEILYRGALPLCCAAFFRRADGEWVRLPKDACEAGMRRWEV